MSTFKYFAKAVAKNPFLTKKFFAFFTQLRIYSASKWSTEQARFLENNHAWGNAENNRIAKESIFGCLKLLRCFDIPDAEFIRIGPPHDGGYVVHKNTIKYQKVFSIGVGNDTSFEEDLLNLNSNIIFYLFDHTEKPKRKLPNNFNFYDVGLAQNSTGKFLNLKDMSQLYLSESDKALLKIDIEGAEYEALMTTDYETLDKFEQIIIELHDIDLDKILSIPFRSLLEKFVANFNLIHIHGNNNDGFVYVNGVCVPRTLELTWLNKKNQLIEVQNASVFPRSLDFPNVQGHDMHLGNFKFRTP